MGIEFANSLSPPSKVGAVEAFLFNFHFLPPIIWLSQRRFGKGASGEIDQLGRPDTGNVCMRSTPYVGLHLPI